MVVPVLPGPVCQSFLGGRADLAQHPHSAISLIRVWWSGRRASIPRSPASKAGGLPNFPTPCLVERTAGLEPAFSTPITVHRFVAGVGYVRDGRAGGPRSRITILRGSYPVQLDDGPKIGSPTSTRTWIDRLTAGRPAVGRSGIGGPPGYRPPRATILQGSSAPLCAARALSWFRSTLSCSSGKRFHQISLQGELERPVGYDPTSSAWRAETLPLSYGRVVGRGRIRTSEPLKGRRLRRRCFGLLHTCPCWLRRAELNGLPLGHEPSELPVLHSGSPLPTSPACGGG